MRRLLGIGIMAMSFSATGREQTAPSGRNTVYIAPNETRTMTVTRAGLVLISVEVPERHDSRRVVCQRGKCSPAG